MDARQMIADLRQVPPERLSDWDRNFIDSCESVLNDPEATLSDERIAKLQGLRDDRTRPLDEHGNFADVQDTPVITPADDVATTTTVDETPQSSGKKKK